MSADASRATLSLAQAAVTLAKALQDEADALFRPPAEVQPSRTETVIPTVLFTKTTRRYLLRVVYQINTCYEDTSYDGCAVMIRRLIESLIIETFEAYGIADKLKNKNGDFKQLNDLIDDMLAETAWNLGRKTKPALKRLKDIGDRSAHDRRYNALRLYIDEHTEDARLVVHELMALAGLY